jgi:hypothetical protein
MFFYIGLSPVNCFVLCLHTCAIVPFVSKIYFSILIHCASIRDNKLKFLTILFRLLKTSKKTPKTSFTECSKSGFKYPALMFISCCKFYSLPNCGTDCLDLQQNKLTRTTSKKTAIVQLNLLLLNLLFSLLDYLHISLTTL